MAKRQISLVEQIKLFKDIAGAEVTDQRARQCLEATNGDLPRALDVFFTLPPEPVSRQAPTPWGPLMKKPKVDQSLPVSSALTGRFLGVFEVNGSLTTRVSPSANKLFPGAFLDVNLTSRVSGKSKIPADEAAALVHGTPIVRFTQSGDFLDIGRLCPDVSCFLYMLAKVNLIDFRISVLSSAKLTGRTLQPGDSVPLKIEVFIMDKRKSQVLAELKLGAVDGELLSDRLRNAWRQLFNALILFPIAEAMEAVGELDHLDTNETPQSEVAIIPPDDSGEINDGEEDLQMSSNVKKLLGEEYFAKIRMPRMRLPEEANFSTTLKPYQEQALYFMTRRELPTCLGGLPAKLKESVDCTGSILEETLESAGHTDEVVTLPPGWAKYQAGDGGDFYMHVGSGEILFSPPDGNAKHGQVLGGIVGDVPGMGKTIMTLALIATDRVRKMTEDVSATLIVVPLSLLRQWRDEAELHGNFSVVEYHGAGRSIPADADIVLTTYGTLATEVGRSSNETPLLSRQWRRVVLDEAHVLRNRATRFNRAVRLLRSKFKWCLSGTPMANGIEDAYSLVSWLEVEPWCSYAYFKKNAIDAPGSRASAVVREMLRPLMLRRTLETRDTSGSKILELKEKRVKVLELALGPAEEDFYSALFWETRTKFTEFVENGSVMMHYTHVLQLIMKLRQSVCHPVLCLKSILTAGPRQAPFGVWDPQHMEPISMQTLVMEFLKVSEQYGKELATVEHEANEECPICLDELDNSNPPVITICGHVMCSVCAKKTAGKLLGECPICRKPVGPENLRMVSKAGDSKSSEDIPPTDPDNRDLSKCPRRRVAPSTKMATLLRYLRRDVLRHGRRVVVFSQFVAFLEILDDYIKAEAPSISVRMVHGAQSIEQRRGSIAWLSEPPVLSSTSSEEVGDAAEDSDEISDDEISGRPGRQGKVLLVSLKCGSVGLNLMSARTCYLMDLWYNEAAEIQAIDRICRIGQTKKVRAYKLVVKNSIDSQIVELQKRKSACINAALGAGDDEDPNMNKRKALDLEDLKMLFKPRPVAGSITLSQ